MSEDLDATTRLAHAITALTSTTPHVLHRDGQEAREQLDQAHREHIAYLRSRHAAAATRKDHAGMRRWINAMTIAGQQHRERRAALIPELTTTPSLIKQLVDAVHSATGAGDGSRGVHRSPLNTAAVELLDDIARTTGWRPDKTQPLDHYVRLLAQHPDGYPDHIAERLATEAEHWLTDARNILEPSRRIEAKAACPICHARHVWIHEDGENVRRAAIQIDLTQRTARCIAPGCTGHWDRDHIDLLARVLEQDVDERKMAL